MRANECTRKSCLDWQWNAPKCCLPAQVELQMQVYQQGPLQDEVVSYVSAHLLTFPHLHPMHTYIVAVKFLIQHLNRERGREQ